MTTDIKKTIDPKTLKVPTGPNALKPPVPSPPSPAFESQPPGITNDEFISAVFNQVSDGAYPAVCVKAGDPTEGGWYSMRSVLNMEKLTEDNNNYLNCSSFCIDEEGNFKARKANFAAYHFLLLDDLGTKVPLDKINGFELSWRIETSPGNFQGGIILSKPITDIGLAERLQKSILSAGFGDEGASGVSRWARLPNAINGKEKYKVNGKPFKCRLVEWRPDKRYSTEAIVDGLNLGNTNEAEVAGSSNFGSLQNYEGDHVFTPCASENPVVSELKKRGLYKMPLGSGKHSITCPWVHEHTDAVDSGAAFFEPNDLYPVGGYVCLHSHRDKYRTKELFDFLCIEPSAAANKPTIRVHQGELHRVVAVAEQELARRGRHFQAGGLIVTIDTDPNTGDPKLLPTNVHSLTRELSALARWEKFDGRNKAWMRSDPPQRHIAILHDSKEYRHLPQLLGLARQPYFRENGGELILESGYDQTSKMFGVFDPRQYQILEPTEENAREALKVLDDLLQEFRFVTDADRSAALSAIFTATVRASLPHAPGFHVRAPSSGSGKSYLCELIGAFAGPAQNSKISYPKTSEEASKVLLSLLLTSPAVIEFDDMDSDWTPHGVINRALTAEHITERILGVTKTATVNTRSLFLGSGNNVGPVRDLVRRVLTINLDPRCSTPATIRYSGSPVDVVKKNRGRYISAVLTVIRAWREVGTPRADVENIATYGGDWADYCRHPLLWLGRPDPATNLLHQLHHDPDAEALGRLLVEWHAEFGSVPTTIRKVIKSELFESELLEAIREFPIQERGRINPSKFGWVLKKNANRIVNGLEFQRTEADGRTAWRVVKVDTQA